MESPFRSQTASPQPTMREAAAWRASAEKSAESLSPETLGMRHSLDSPFTATPQTYRYPQEQDLASSARKEWRLHKSGMTQDLEERRISRGPGTISVRVLAFETRLDLSNKTYTTYIMQVTLANNDVILLERRYSEFSKLNDLFRSHNIRLDTSFPSKSVLGRVGNWTPSLHFAPQQNRELVEYRKVQLDVWIVHCVQKYNEGDLPHSLGRKVYEFLTQPKQRPCDQENNLLPTAGKSKWNNPLSFTLGSSIRQATSTLEHMVHFEREELQSIPIDLLGCAKGLCFLTVIKAGLVVSGRVGTGLLISRVGENEWSAPLALGVSTGPKIPKYFYALTVSLFEQDSRYRLGYASRWRHNSLFGSLDDC